MQEVLLQFIWGNKLFQDIEYIADTGERIQILDVGIKNFDGGPDFTNSKIRINNTLWAGNTEIHVKASDWYAHGHQKNNAYNNVILHIAENQDTACLNSGGRKIPTITLLYNKEILNGYRSLIEDHNDIGCRNSLRFLDPSLISFWLNTLAIERLQEKTEQIRNTLETTHNDWEETFFIHIARSFGLKINALPFEMLAKATPFKIVLKHCHNLTELEALLFGQAGMLDTSCSDKYVRELQGTYRYLKNKYHLKPVDKYVWKFLRLRPNNFPTLRIAQLCSLYKKTEHLFSKSLDCSHADQLYDLFICSVSDYWKNHYIFGKESILHDKSIGKTTIHSIIINTIVPFIYNYGYYKNNTVFMENSLILLETLNTENNAVIRKWSEFHIHAKNAAQSQSLLQLFTNYCVKKRCLHCRIGSLILRNRQLHHVGI